MRLFSDCFNLLFTAETQRTPKRSYNQQIDLSACGHAQAGRLVYELYGLTEEEIAIVEKGLT